ncbi:hypothetical protein [Sulfobacillus harzensis]|uniref:Uncharacterized protein n=1 Tax=Sulfobacillus harzensis TaxID=2729629 RepID=A0A7Y0L612_9FIRM|nr:hypothetical protein [Sulfobacillus harzensis]NMP22554.1 hypothetical protein [Sulfobacillus harzensis]
MIGCARLLHMDQAPTEVVLAGSLWLGQAPHLKDAFFQRLNRDRPMANARITELRPVAGAVLTAIGTRGKNTRALREVLKRDSRLTGVE